MPVRLAPGDSAPAPTSRSTASSARSTWLDGVAAIVQDIAETVVEITHRILIPTVWTRWTTAADDKVCPICAPYAGRVWPETDGPSPPLHPNCRCTRAYAFTTWSIRDS
jgi:hypothetical protein